MTDLKNGKKIGIAIITIIIAVSGIVFFLYQKNISKMRSVVEVDTIYEGITVEGVDVFGLTKEEAVLFLNRELQENINSKVITLKAGDKRFDMSYEKFDAKYDVKSAVNEAYDFARVGTLKERYKQIKSLEDNKLNIEVGYSYNEEKIKEEITSFEEEIYVPVQNSTMSRKNGSFVITDEQVGYDFDIEKTATDVINMVKESKSGEIEAHIVEKLPEVTKADNQKATSLIGTFYTTFSSGPAGRNENLRVGSKNINGTLLKPGDVFSSNESLGPQTYANGYRDAAVIVNGKIEDGMAGGVCQITTTLYNAVIFSELEVVERSNHSLPVGYVPLGRDAAIAGDYKDFKFKNNTEYPVYVETYLDGNKLVANIYGHEIHQSGRTVEFEKVFLETIPKPAEKVTLDPQLPDGERVVTYNGKTGSKVSTYKKVYQNGELLSREWFSNSTYRATANEVSVGTKKVQSEPASIEVPVNKEPPVTAGGENIQSQDSEPITGNNQGEIENIVPSVN